MGSLTQKVLLCLHNICAWASVALHTHKVSAALLMFKVQ